MKVEFPTVRTVSIRQEIRVHDTFVHVSNVPIRSCVVVGDEEPILIVIEERDDGSPNVAAISADGELWRRGGTASGRVPYSLYPAEGQLRLVEVGGGADVQSILDVATGAATVLGPWR